MKEGTFEYIEQKIHRDANGTSFGGDFEWLVKYFLENYPPYKSIYEKVYFPPEKDLGNDLIGKKYSGGLTAIQCKGFAAHRTIYKYHIDSFLNESSNPIYEDRMLVASTDRLGHNTLESIERHSKPVLRIMRSDLLAANFIWPSQIGALPLPRKIWTPKLFQSAMIEEILKGFQIHDRGRLIAACGLGKTYISFKVAQQLHCRLLLILVPTISLVSQIVSDWQNYSEEPIDVLAVCSDEKMGHSREEFLFNETVASLGPMKVTEDPNVIQRFMETPRKGLAAIVVCYPSSDKIAAACKKSKVHFDLAIADEAHNTTSSGVASTILYSGIKVHKRLFMTATPRLYSERIIELSRKNNCRVHSMDEEKFFGPVFCQRSFGWAIREGYIADYRVVGMEVTENEIQGLQESVQLSVINRKKVTADGKVKTDMLSLGTEMITAKAAKKFGTEKILTCHSRVKQAKKFTESFPWVYKKLENRRPLQCCYVTGEMTADLRKLRLYEFASFPGVSTVSHCQALSEGVNSPYMDMIMFGSPKQSVQDIVQNIGRGLRKPDIGPKTTTIVIPILINKGAKGKLQVDADSAYNTISKVVGALRAYDEEFAEQCASIMLNAGSPGSVTALPEKVQIIQSPDVAISDVQREIFYRDITTQIVQAGAEFLAFEKARVFVHELGIKNKREWHKYAKSKKRPACIPSNPSQVYEAKDWKGWGDWLGTGEKRKVFAFLSFKQARAKARKKRLRSKNEWFEWCKSGKKPENIPYNPSQVYKNKAWKGWGDWLGTEIVAPQLRKYFPFKRAKAFVHTQGLKSQTHWHRYCVSGKKPECIPSRPDVVYKDKGWNDWGDWLGTGNVHKKKFRSYQQTHVFAVRKGFKSGAEWKEFSKSGTKPDDIPANPNQYYKGKGWKGWGDFLGTGNVHKKKFRSYEQTRTFAREKGIRSKNEWRKFCKSGKKPKDIPSNLERSYNNKGWKGWGDFLGTGRIADRDKNQQFLPFVEARAFVRSLNLKTKLEWLSYRDSGKKPNNIPRSPDHTYKYKGWKNTADWLGVEALAGTKRIFLPFNKARSYVHSLKLRTKTEWYVYSKSGTRPLNIPGSPPLTYEKSWKSWADWLGTEKEKRVKNPSVKL